MLPPAMPLVEPLYKLAAGYNVDKKEFTLTPTVTIKF